MNEQENKEFCLDSQAVDTSCPIMFNFTESEKLEFEVFDVIYHTREAVLKNTEKCVEKVGDSRVF